MDFLKISSIKDAEDFCKNQLTDYSPFINYYFFFYLEKTLCTSKNNGWEPEHIIIKENEKIIGFIPNFKKFNSNGEYIFDHAWENAHYQMGIEYFPKYLSATPFTPVTRESFLYTNKNINNLILTKKLINFFQDNKVSSFHINFIDKKVSDNLKDNFLQRIGIQYHWFNKNYKSFDDFLKNLKSRKKKNILKERDFLRKNKIKFVKKLGNNITEQDLNLFFECYLNTIKKKWSYQYLNIDFFRKIFISDLKKKILLISAFDNKQFLGCSLHFLGNNTLYGRYSGTLTDIPFLHFELCYYQAIEYAIQKNISKIEAGAQGEHKIARGYIPTIIYSNHWIRNEKLKGGIKKFLDYEKGEILSALEIMKRYSPFND